MNAEPYMLLRFGSCIMDGPNLFVGFPPISDPVPVLLDVKSPKTLGVAPVGIRGTGEAPTKIQLYERGAGPGRGGSCNNDYLPYAV